MKTPAQAWPPHLSVTGGRALPPCAQACHHCKHLTILLVISQFVPTGAGLGCLGCESCMLCCCHRGGRGPHADGLHYPHPTVPLIHLMSSPTSILTPVIPHTLSPKSFGSPSSFLYPIIFQPSSYTDPFISSCPRGSALLHLKLRSGHFLILIHFNPRCQW